MVQLFGAEWLQIFSKGSTKWLGAGDTWIKGLEVVKIKKKEKKKSGMGTELMEK